MPQLHAPKILLMLLGSLLLSQAVEAGCWTPQDRAHFRQSEMEGITLLSFRDALSCEPVTNAQVTFGKHQFTTDSRGTIGIEALATSMDERLPMVVKKRGYMTLNTEVRLELGGVVHNRFALSPQIDADAMRFILTWSFQPADLDLHLEGPGFHISYRDMRSARNTAKLDTDAQDGFGPETITLKRLDPAKRYRLYVNHFSHDGALGSNEQVDIYAHGLLDRSIELPRTAKDNVEILTIHNGVITYTNQPF